MSIAEMILTVAVTILLFSNAYSLSHIWKLEGFMAVIIAERKAAQGGGGDG